MEVPALENMISESMVVCSDVHLYHEQDPRGKKLDNLISRIDPNKVECFVLNGDIFDFCFGDSTYFKEKFKNIGQKLEKLCQKGVKVYFVQGNHEFFSAKLGWSGVTFVDGWGASICLKNGVEVAFCHGDLINAPWHYLYYYRFTRSLGFRLLGHTLPQRFLDGLALSISKKSRERSSYKKVPHRSVLEAASQWLLTKHPKAQFGIFGHFHTSYEYSLPLDHNKKLFCLKNWDEPNFLAFDGYGFKRVYF